MTQVERQAIRATVKHIDSWFTLDRGLLNGDPALPPELHRAALDSAICSWMMIKQWIDLLIAENDDDAPKSEESEFDGLEWIR